MVKVCSEDENPAATVHTGTPHSTPDFSWSLTDMDISTDLYSDPNPV